MVPQDIITAIRELKKKHGKGPIKQSYYSLIEKLVFRLDSFSNDCAECDALRQELYVLITALQKEYSNKSSKQGPKLINKCLSHLHKKHNLLRQDHYTNIYTANGAAIGISLGTAFFAAFNNVLFLSIGVALGAAIGLSFGQTLDAKTKRDGLIL